MTSLVLTRGQHITNAAAATVVLCGEALVITVILQTTQCVGPHMVFRAWFKSRDDASVRLPPVPSGKMRILHRRHAVR